MSFNSGTAFVFAKVAKNFSGDNEKAVGVIDNCIVSTATTTAILT